VPTRYEVDLYRDVERIRKAAELRADIETCRYLRERLRDSAGDKSALSKQLAETERRVLVVPK
jgi:hypothetical protein